LSPGAASWSGALRLEDVIARVGGDEFVAILPDCAPEDAQRAAKRLRLAADGVSLSSGIAQWDGLESIETLLHRADLEMYRGKRTQSDQTMNEARPRADGERPDRKHRAIDALGDARLSAPESS
jgi:diguanylate cyclase (GGDEF)-like protein